MSRCLLFLLLSASASAQLANSPPVPQWLAAPEAGTTFTHVVKHEGKLLKAVLLTVVWSGVVSFLAFKLVDMTIGLRVSEEEEREGLDISSHGETAYSR